MPIPLNTFRSNFKLDRNTFDDIVSYNHPITMKFCIFKDGTAVMECAKFCCDWFSFDKLNRILKWTELSLAGWSLSLRYYINYMFNGRLPAQEQTRTYLKWNFQSMKFRNHKLVSQPTFKFKCVRFWETDRLKPTLCQPLDNTRICFRLLCYNEFLC